jgi:hypothetical protein
MIAAPGGSRASAGRKDCDTEGWKPGWNLRYDLIDTPVTDVKRSSLSLRKRLY